MNEIFSQNVDKLFVIKIIVVQYGIIKERLHGVVQVSSSLPNFCCRVSDDAWQLFESCCEYYQTVVV